MLSTRMCGYCHHFINSVFLRLLPLSKTKVRELEQWFYILVFCTFSNIQSGIWYRVSTQLMTGWLTGPVGAFLAVSYK